MKSINLESSSSYQPAAEALRQNRSYAWMVATLFVLLAAMFAAGSARSQQAPANAVIGNQASATYVDVTNTLVTLTSTSNTVQTTVSQVFSLLLSAGGTSVKPANQQVCYPHTITNTGNGTDTFALTTTTTPFVHNTILFYPDVSPSDGVPDAGPSITSTPALGAGQTYTFVVCGTTPPAATGSGSIIVRATSTSTSIFASATDTTTIGNCSIALTKTLSTTPPPGITPITGGASPNANTTAPYVGSGLFVVIGYTNSGSVACDNVIITDNLTAAGGGFLYRITSGRWSNTGAGQALTDAADLVETYSGNSIDYSAPTTDLAVGSVVAKIGTVASSTSGNIYFRVNVKTGLLVGSASTANTATVSYTDSGTVTPILTGSSNTATYNVQQVADVAFNGSATSSTNTAGEGTGTTVVASASPGQTIQWTNYVWNRGNSSDNFDIRFADGTGTVTGTSATFSGANCTNGTGAAPICTFPAGTVFTAYRSDGVTTLLDNSGNSIPDTGPIPLPTAGDCPVGFVGNGAAGLSTACGYAIVIKAVIPAGATTGAGPYSITLQARSVYDTAVVDTVPNVLTTIAANSVDLRNNSATGPGAGVTGNTVISTLSHTPSASTSTIAQFLLAVNNTSPVALIFDLSATTLAVPSGVGLSTAPALPVNWQVQFKLVAPGGTCATAGSVTLTTGAVPVPATTGSQLICAEVTVPPTNQGNGGSRPTDAPPGNYDIIFRAEQSGNAAVFDIKVDRISLQPARAVAVTPNGNQQTSPGGAVTYQHTITNSGNVPEIITFAGGALVDSGSPSWTSAGYLDDGGNQASPVQNGVLTVGTDTNISSASAFTMAPNTTRTIFVRVNAPNVYSNTPNITTLTTTYTYSAAALTAQVTDTTTMNSGLRLDKYQVLTSCSTAPSGTTFLANAPNNNGWSSSAIPAGVSTAPGQCIAYLVVGVNTTANNISNISIQDIVPTNTKFRAACSPTAPAHTTGVLTTSVIPADNATGTIVAVSAPSPGAAADPNAALLPGGRVTLQFCVKIN